MKANPILASAIASVLATGAASAAVIPPAGPYATKFVISGSSAAQPTFESVISGICTAGTITYYSSKTQAPAAASSNSNFQAYTCTLVNNAALIGAAAAGTDAIFYYRADGGSVTGVEEFLPTSTHAGGFTAGQGTTLNRLDEGATTCVLNGAVASTTFAATANYGCSVPAAYNSFTDPVVAGLTYDFVNMGVSDLEPTVFSGENFGTQFTFAGPVPTPAALKAIPSTPLVNQVFQLVTSNAAVTNLSRYAAANIFDGTYSDWAQVPTGNLGALGLNGDAGTAANPSGYAAGPITVCRRDAGSGTQAGASIVFEDQGCNASAKPFITALANNPVVINTSTGNLITCLSGHANAIGFVVVQKAGTLPAGVQAVNIDGIPGDQTRAALGVYPWMFELTVQHLANSLNGNGQAGLFTYFTGTISANATDPSSLNLVSVPGIGGNKATLNSGAKGLTYSAVNNIPIALGTRGGNSCSILVGKNQKAN